LQADDVKLGRRTIWLPDAAEFTIAYGQKVVTTGDTDCPILELRTLEVDL
jgi:protein involved in temperature-dependent protein secretion